MEIELTMQFWNSEKNSNLEIEKYESLTWGEHIEWEESPGLS